MLHVQQILTEWSDLDRSQEVESKREQIADIMRVPYFEPDAENVWHRVRYRQAEDYHCTEMVGDLEKRVPLRVGSILLSPHPGILIVDFIWSEDTTWLPKRESSRGFRLRPDEWGQVKYSGWSSDPKRENGRRFQMLVFNILFDAKLTRERFLETEPAYVFDQTTDLQA